MHGRTMWLIESNVMLSRGSGAFLQHHVFRLVHVVPLFQTRKKWAKRNGLRETVVFNFA